MAYNNGPPTIVTDGLVLYLDAANYRSYPQTGSVWSDLAANRSASLSGPSFSGSVGAGSFGFDGVNDYAFIPNDDTLNITTLPVTLVCWANLANVSENRTLFGKGSATSGQGGYEFRLDTSNRLNLVKYFIADQRVTLPTITTGSWNQFVAVQGTTQVNYYINGSYAGQFTNSTPFQTNSLELRIGRNRSGSEEGSLYTQGYISSVMMYNRALSAQEVTQNFNAMRGRFGV